MALSGESRGPPSTPFDRLRGRAQGALRQAQGTTLGGACSCTASPKRVRRDDLVCFKKLLNRNQVIKCWNHFPWRKFRTGWERL